jgi:hypothetical protein
LLTRQWEHLLEIQQIQVELMEEMQRRLPGTSPGAEERAPERKST